MHKQHLTEKFVINLRSGDLRGFDSFDKPFWMLIHVEKKIIISKLTWLRLSKNNIQILSGLHLDNKMSIDNVINL